MAGRVKLHCGEPPRAVTVCMGRDPFAAAARSGSSPRFKGAAACCLFAFHHRDIVIAHPQPVEVHRETPPADRPLARGLVPLDASTRAMLRQWRRPDAPPGLRLPGLVLALLLHALFALAIWNEMRPPAHAASSRRPDQVLQVRLIATAPRPAAPPPPAPPPLPRPVAPPRAILKRPVPPARDAMTVQLPAPPPATPPPLYDRDGKPRLPATAASTAPGYVQRMPAGDTQIMQHTSPLPYKATRFEQYFPPPGETLGGAVVRHVVEAVVNSKDVDLPRGVHLKCTTLLGVPIPNCVNPPAPPSKKDGDERLSMAPAKPLAIDPHAPPPPGIEACIAMYRAGQPLAWGCPVDTPDRAVDDELRRHAAGAARHR